MKMRLLFMIMMMFLTGCVVRQDESKYTPRVIVDNPMVQIKRLKSAALVAQTADAAKTGESETISKALLRIPQESYEQQSAHLVHDEKTKQDLALIHRCYYLAGWRDVNVFFSYDSDGNLLKRFGLPRKVYPRLNCYKIQITKWPVGEPGILFLSMARGDYILNIMDLNGRLTYEKNMGYPFFYQRFGVFMAELVHGSKPYLVMLGHTKSFRDRCMLTILSSQGDVIYQEVLIDRSLSKSRSSDGKTDVLLLTRDGLDTLEYSLLHH